MLIHHLVHTPASGEWCSKWARESVCDFHQQCLLLRYSPVQPEGVARRRENLIRGKFSRCAPPHLTSNNSVLYFNSWTNNIKQLWLFFKNLIKTACRIITGAHFISSQITHYPSLFSRHGIMILLLFFLYIEDQCQPKCSYRIWGNVSIVVCVFPPHQIQITCS